MNILKVLDRMKEKVAKAAAELLPRPAPQLAPIPVRHGKPQKRR